MDYQDREGLQYYVERVLKDAGYDDLDGFEDSLVEALADAYADTIWYLAQDFTESVVFTYEQECEEALYEGDVHEYIFEELGYSIDDSEVYENAYTWTQLLCWAAPGQTENFNLEGGEFDDTIEDDIPVWDPVRNLMEQQGYTTLVEGSKLCDSIRVELEENSYPLGFFTIPVTLTLEDYIRVKREGGTFIANENRAILGVFNPTYGAGGVLGIELEKDFMFTVTPEELVVDGTYGYGLLDVYGFTAEVGEGTKLMS